MQEAAYPVVLVISKDRGVQVAYPANLASQRLRKTLELPAGPEWWTLEPPEGTITIVLLARDGPLEDQTALRREVAALGRVPNVDSDTMLLLDDGEVLPLRASPGRIRSVDVRTTVISDAGLLERLPEVFGDRWDVIFGLVVPQARVEPSDG